MSLEKIIERIKRIESNDFAINEDIKFDPGELDKLRSKLDATSGNTNKQSRQQQQNMRLLGMANNNVHQTNQLAKNTVSGFNRISLGSHQHVPDQCEPMVFGIYNIFRKYGVLSGYIDKKNQAINGYSERGKELQLNSNGKSIVLYFKYDFEDKLPMDNELYALSAHFKYEKFNVVGVIQNIENDIMSNAQSLNVKQTDWDDKNEILTVYFN